jgi:hypothetical protein
MISLKTIWVLMQTENSTFGANLQCRVLLNSLGHLYPYKYMRIGVDFHRQQGSSTPNNFNAGQTPYRLALLALAISPCHLLWMGLGTLNIFSKSTPLYMRVLSMNLIIVSLRYRTRHLHEIYSWCQTCHHLTGPATLNAERHRLMRCFNV